MIHKTCRVIALAVFIAASWAAPLQALQIYQFDKMAGKDQDQYIALLVTGAEKVLKDDGRAEDAAKVSKLFTTNAENGISIGMNEFMMTLALARKTDADRWVKDPNAVRLEVEHAMFIMLKHNDIRLPKSFLKVGNGFTPKHPLK